jgi:hypothetical protein
MTLNNKQQDKEREKKEYLKDKINIKNLDQRKEIEKRRT